MFSELKKELRVRDLTDQVARYEMPNGNSEFRSTLAKFMQRTFFAKEISPDHLVITNGTGPALEMLAFCLCNPGDGIMIPAPYYAGFDIDFSFRPEVKVIPAPCAPEENFDPTAKSLEAAFQKAVSEGVKVKVLALSSPSNPTGSIYSRERLEEIIEWAKSHQLHIISDEIYALSVYGGEDAKFTSASCFYGRDKDLDNRLHILWGFSKDFGISGFRCGVLYTENPELLKAIGVVGFFTCASNDVQFGLNAMLKNEAFVDEYLKQNRLALRGAYETVVRCIEDLPGQVSYIPAQAGFFVWVNLASFLPQQQQQKCAAGKQSGPDPAEMQLFWHLFNEAKVILTPGTIFHSEEPGWFRVCFAAAPREAIKVAFQRIKEALLRLQQQQQQPVN
eukprot:GEZU01020702.1.p1 GENE.GEZU01020702.1~~GEZU01020702.1.p1  ORF type:complete len:391 (-),score=116.06 GEZU01020702.1:55-1227(-)